MNNKFKKDLPGYIVVIWLLIVIIILAYMTGCEKIDIQMESQDYYIPKGEHYAQPLVLEDWGARIVTDWTLDESCIYEFENENQYDWNKLIGLVYHSHTRVHDYSCRAVWRWDIEKGMFALGYYVYEAGERISGQLGYIEAGKKFRVSVTDYGDRWRVAIETFDGSLMVYQRIEKESRNLNHYKVLTPYFGGDETAPHDMVLKSELITIKRN